ncbi:MAG TPA: CRISPR-associated protein Cas4 [Clostridia bacterium]|nr:CRISPR-associated protein Cas4 [Clostridia bacterium]
MSREPLPISALQHLAFCPRQWGLIHVEQAWVENRLTAEGRLMHEKADSGTEELRGGVRIVRGLLLESRILALTGRADVVEFRPAPFPVEYKRGKAKPTDCDIVQLCAQALCLEEMLGTSVPAGAIFYGEPRRRTEVAFSDALRERTTMLTEQMHTLHAAGVTPAATPGRHCRNCSLVALCLPNATSGERSALRWFENVAARRWREE